MFQRTKTKLRALRFLAAVTAASTGWLVFPRTVFARAPEPRKPVSRLAEKGLTQTPDDALLEKIAQRERGERNKPRTDVRELTDAEMQSFTGRGQYRNQYYSGTMPWQRSLRGVNLSNGNLFQNFTDMQVASGRGGGLVLQRTYNSNDERPGPFGIGWTHAYDIRINETFTVDSGTGDEIVTRKDFFGGTHQYRRDADGLYSPPAYAYDETESTYDDYLVNGPPTVVEDIQKGLDGSIKHFVPGGTQPDGSASFERVCDYMEDRHGNRTTLTYGLAVTMPDSSTKKLLTEVKDSVNRTLTFTWSNIGSSGAPMWRITQVQGPVYSVQYEYYTNSGQAASYGNLWKVKLDSSGLNQITTFEYTSASGENGLLSKITDPLGHYTTYDYGLARWGYSSSPTGTLWVYRITEPGGVDAGNNPRRHQWRIASYLIPGGLRADVDDYNGTDFEAGDGTNFNEYVGFSFLSDQQLRVNNVQECIGVVPGMHALTATPNDLVIYYDGNNNVVRHTQSYIGGKGSNTTLNGARYTGIVATYGPHGNVLTQGLEGFPGTTTTYTYYDASKYFQKKSITDPNGHTSEFDYYPKASSLTSPSATDVGRQGQVMWVRNARYSVTGKQFTYDYNSYGQKIKETNLKDVVTKFEYGDSWGNLTRVLQDPSDLGTGYVGLNREATTTYNVTGQKTQATDWNGQAITFTYNSLGQPLTVNFPAKTGVSAAETVSYSYGTNGRTESVTDNRGTTTIAYESGSERVASITDPVTGTISYKYTDGGQRKSMTLPGGGTVSYTYDQTSGRAAITCDNPEQLNRLLKTITDDTNRQVEITQDRAGHTTKVRFNQNYNSGGSLVSYCETEYDLEETSGGVSAGWPATTGRLWRMRTTFTQVGGASNILSQNTYTYNNNGQRLTNTILDSGGTSRTETYGYDALSQLTSANYGDGQTQSYTFDSMSNRLTKTDNVTGNEGYTFDNANRITSRTVGSSTQGYISDVNGNILTDGIRANAWDSQNRLVQCVKGTGTNAVTSEFIYGLDGLRRKMTVTNGTATAPSSIAHFGYDMQNLVREWSEDPTTHARSISATYLQGASGPMYKRPANAADVRWYVYDGLGSVVGEVDVLGNLTSSRKHDVYGLPRQVTGTPTSKHGWVGGLGHLSEDETGLIYMRARYYDPALGRFTSLDPSTAGINWFVYCDNDPVNKTDASGRNPQDNSSNDVLKQECIEFLKLIVKTCKLGLDISEWAVRCVRYHALEAIEDAMHALDASIEHHLPIAWDNALRALHAWDGKNFDELLMGFGESARDVAVAAAHGAEVVSCVLAHFALYQIHLALLAGETEIGEPDNPW